MSASSPEMVLSTIAGDEHLRARARDFLSQNCAPNSRGCLVWTGSRDDGYGRPYVMGARVQAARLAYVAHVGPVPDGLVIDHLCRNRACVNHEHLEPVTNRENVLRGEGVTARQHRKTHCKRGHPLSGDNLRLNRGGSGKTDCRVCRKCERLRRAARVEGASVRKRLEPAESPYDSPGGLNKCGTGALLLGGTTALHQPVPHHNNNGPGRKLPSEPRDQGQNGA